MINPFLQLKIFGGSTTDLHFLLKEIMATLVYDISRSCYAYLNVRHNFYSQAGQLSTTETFSETLTASILDEITLGLHQFFDLSDVGVLLVDKKRQEYCSIARQGVFRRSLQAGVYRQKLGTGLIGRCHRLAQTVLVNDTSREPDMHHVPGVPILSELLVPIKYTASLDKTEVLAVFDVGSIKRNAFDIQQQELLETVAECLAPVIHDPLKYLAENIAGRQIAVTTPQWDALLRTLSFMNTYLTASRQRNALQISQSAGMLADTVASQANKAGEQVRHMQESRQVAEEVELAAQQIAQETHRLRRLGEQAATQMNAGQLEVNQAAHTMQKLALSANRNATTSTSLLARLGEIRRVGTLLQEVGEETNLLALNATIEASGAGQLGQRFGIVASEIRNLAERVKSESQFISNMLKQVEKQSDELQRSNAELGATISALSGQLDGAGLTLGQARLAVERTESGIQLVEQLTGQQEQNGELIATTLQQACELAENMAQEEAELAVAVSQLKEIAARLGS